MIELIPAIDILGGKCVRLQQGDYSLQQVYSDQPVRVALQFEEMGLGRLHLVDLDGARTGNPVNLQILEEITAKTSLLVDFGGGVKSDHDLRRVFEAGAEMVTVGSLAVKDPPRVKQWLEDYGSRRILLGADARNGRIAIHGWQEDTGEALLPFVREWVKAGIRTLICTDIPSDGMMGGPSTGLYRELRQAFPETGIIASGGVSSMQDINTLEALGIDGVVFGKAFYEGRITQKEIMNHIKSG